tara:strand:- start:5083 stop:6219 length:1137 start_codon:yes stop_codon:yes gene_type:complete
MDYLYLDHAATSPMRESIWSAMKKAEEVGYGNPSGSHKLSRKAKNIVEESREVIAASVGAAPEEIIFTSSGTESDNWSIKSPFQSCKPTAQDLVVSSIEHEAVLESAKWIAENGYKVSFVDPNKDGKVESSEFINNITETTSVASLMWGNNETGVLQPVSEIGKEIKENTKLIFHSDIVQGFVSTKIDFHKHGITSAAMSAHKIGGPKGIGFMFLHNKYKIDSYLHGGKQELERRAGTVNVVGVAGFAAAVKEHQERFDEEVGLIKNEKNIFEESIIENTQIRVIGIESERLPHISNIQIKGVNSENLLVLLDLDGVGVSRGSACSSGAQKPSHVLEAMEIKKEDLNSHLRISFGWTTQVGDGSRAADKIINTIRGIR